MPRIVLAPTAEKDLEGIWKYIADDNPVAADTVVREIHWTCESLSASPYLGRVRDELVPHMRSLAVGKYIVFYRPMKDGITVERILHGARDLPSLF